MAYLTCERNRTNETSGRFVSSQRSLLLFVWPSSIHCLFLSLLTLNAYIVNFFLYFFEFLERRSEGLTSRDIPALLLARRHTSSNLFMCMSGYSVESHRTGGVGTELWSSSSPTCILAVCHVKLYSPDGEF